MIHSACAECKAKMQDGVLEHLETCTAKSFERGYYRDTARPPAIVLTFDTPEEQAEWLRKLTGGSAKAKPESELAQ